MKKKVIHDDFKDLGFGTRVTARGQRMLNKDGSFNVEKKGLSFFEGLSLYHELITMSWFKFNVLIVLFYALANLFFAGLYMLVGIEHLDGIKGSTITQKFVEAFFFSAQTITTLGYGRISPIGLSANIITAIESMAGLLGFALATGLLYGRFSRPKAKLLYSKHAIIGPYNDITAFMFRFANSRKSQLIEAEVQLTFSITETINDQKTRRFHELNLERNKINFLSLSWTIVHPIEDNSPLKGLSHQDLINGESEFILLFKAFDDTFSQTVHSRTSFRAEEIIWGAKFETIFGRNSKGMAILELHKMHNVAKVEI